MAARGCSHFVISTSELFPVKESSDLTVVRADGYGFVVFQNAVVGDVACYKHRFGISEFTNGLVEGVSESFERRRQRGLVVLAASRLP